MKLRSWGHTETNWSCDEFAATVSRLERRQASEQPGLAGTTDRSSGWTSTVRRSWPQAWMRDDGMARKPRKRPSCLAGDPRRAPRLRGFAREPRQERAVGGGEGARGGVDPASVDAFVQLLDDPESDIRWLAATGLIALGPRSVRPVLQSLTDPAVPRGHLEMSHRILGELAKENGVLAGIVGPVLEMLGGNDPGVVAATAARALSDLDRATGRPPDPSLLPPGYRRLNSAARLKPTRGRATAAKPAPRRGPPLRRT